MEVVWHGHYVKYLEIARTELMASLGLNWPTIRDLGYSMPVVDLQLRYVKPARYGQRITILSRIANPVSPALTVDYQIVESGQQLAYGQTRQVYCRLADQSLCFQIPDVILEKFLAAAPEANPDQRV